MKKALSVLLVAAALFGFYGSAVTVNDLLACKDYWEEAGEKSTADMNKLEDGLNQLKDNEQAYLDGKDQLADAEVQLAEGEATLAQGEADYAAAPGKLAAARSAIASGEKELAAGKSTLDGAKALLKQLKDGVKELQDQQKGYPAWRNGYETAVKTAPDTVAALSTNGSLDGTKVDAKITEVQGTLNNLKPYKEQYEGLDTLKETIAGKGFIPKAMLPDAVVGVLSQMGAQTVTVPDVGECYKESDVKAAADAIQKQINDGVKAQAGLPPEAPVTVLNIYKQAEDGLKSLQGLKQLVEGKKTIQDKLLPLLDKDAVKNNDVIKQQLGDVNKIIKGLKADDKTFEATMDQIMQKAPALVAAVEKAVNQGQKDYDAGRQKLAAGKAQYRQGLADYAAAPGKLAAGRQQLADGYKQYEDGKAQLAQYEDGEQQIRDGLATLFNTEADLDLVSIADRLNGDGDFDNGDKHLEIEEGLNAVDVGRGYQAEDGVLITDEIMGRAVATGGLIAAAVLAVIAAILSFLKKNKGAAVFAILAAAAGAFGAFYGPAQGTYFSDIAGSTVGTTTWVAAGILGAVALVHAIVHFAAPKNA